MKNSRSVQAFEAFQEHLRNLHALERTIKQVEATADALHGEIGNTEANVQNRKKDTRAVRADGDNGLPAKRNNGRKKKKEQ
jgi:hypothetical protein